MAFFREHCEDCERELGSAFPQVHLWLDELYKYVGVTHRRFRHNTGGVRHCRLKWGDKTAKAAEIHIRRDIGGVPEGYVKVWTDFWPGTD